MSRLKGVLRAWRGGFAALAVILLAGLSYPAYRSYQAAQARAQTLTALRTEAVSRGDVVHIVSAAGSLLPEQQSNLGFLIPGVVAEVLVKPGDSVRAGQVLARLDATPLQLAMQQAEDALRVAELNRQKLLAGPSPGDIAVAQANLHSANAAVSLLLKGAGPQEINIAQIQYDKLLADYQAAANNYNSTVEAAKEKPASAPSPERLATLKLNMETAYYAAEVGRLQLELAQQGADKGSLAVAYAQVTQARAALEQLQAPPTAVKIQQADLAMAQARLALEQARLRASRAELLAPFDSVVAAVNAKVGEPAESATPAVVVMDPTRFHLDVTVDEADVVQLAVGQKITIIVEALPDQQLTGQVDRLAPTAIVSGGLVHYTVRIVLDSSPLTISGGRVTTVALRSGMSALAQITVAEARDVVRVPNWAIRRDRRTGQAYASLQVGDQLVEAPIETGLRGESYTEVKSGVKVGDVAAVSTTPEQINLLGSGN